MGLSFAVRVACTGRLVLPCLRRHPLPQALAHQLHCELRRLRAHRARARLLRPARVRAVENRRPRAAIEYKVLQTGRAARRAKVVLGAADRARVLRPRQLLRADHAPLLLGLRHLFAACDVCQGFTALQQLRHWPRFYSVPRFDLLVHTFVK